MPAPPLRGAAAPPPPRESPAASSRRSYGRRRAAAARRLLDRHGWVTDGCGYPSRAAAHGRAYGLRLLLIKHEAYAPHALRRRVVLKRDGWHWLLGLQQPNPCGAKVRPDPAE